jgi:hypothetical protein
LMSISRRFNRSRARAAPPTARACVLALRTARSRWSSARSQICRIGARSPALLDVGAALAGSLGRLSEADDAARRSARDLVRPRRAVRAAPRGGRRGCRSRGRPTSAAGACG